MLFGRSRWATKRTSGLSMPMPKAMVATITTPSSRWKRAWCAAARRRCPCRRGTAARRMPLAGEPGGGLVDLARATGSRRCRRRPACSSRMKRSSCARGVVLVDDGVADVRPVEAGRRTRARRRAPAGATISARVCGSAVAVSAMRGTPGKRSCSSDSCRYSGRKSWPHCDTQCASSMANSAMRARSSSSRQRGVDAAARARRRAGRARRRAARARPRAAAPASSVELRNAARTPSCCSAATWSCISAISGETTTPVPVAQQRRDLVAQRLAAAGGHQHQRVAAGRRRARRSPPARRETPV